MDKSEILEAINMYSLMFKRLIREAIKTEDMHLLAEFSQRAGNYASILNELRSELEYYGVRK